MHTMHYVKNSPIYGPDIIQTWPRIFYCRLAVAAQSNRGQGQTYKGYGIHVDAIQSSVDMPDCISMEEIQQVSLQDAHLQQLKTFIIAGLATCQG